MSERIALTEAEPYSNAREHPFVFQIQSAVAEHFGVAIIDLMSCRQDKLAVTARHVAMYLSRTLTPYSLPQIGRRFGGRDHTTVLNAVRRIYERAAADPDFGERVASLRAKFDGGKAVGP